MKWEGAKWRIDDEENTGAQSRKEEIKENETKVRKGLKRIRESGQRRSNICKIDSLQRRKTKTVNRTNI